MRVERGEVKFSGNEKQDRAHGFKACISTSLALCCLKQAIDGLNETVGLTGLGPGNDSIEMSANQTDDILHGLDLGAHDVGAPLVQHLGDDVDLFALENVAQLFSVKPGSRGAVGRVLTDQRLKVGELREVQFVGVLEQRPTHAFKLRVEFLLLPTYCVERLGRVSDDVELVKGNSRFGEMFIDALDESRRHVDADRAHLLG